MALSDLVLAAGEVVVILSDSTLGITSDEVAMNFGIVQSVNQLCDKFEVGNSVWFDKDKAIPFMIISGQVFYKVKETDISGTEPIF